MRSISSKRGKKERCPQRHDVMELRDIVLFLGAGFSKEAGLPTISEFGAESADQLFRLKRPHNIRKSTPYLVEAGDIFARFQEYCKKAKRFINLDTNNMEELFCIAEALSEAKIKNLDLDEKGILINDLVIEIKIWLWKIYQQCPPLNPAKNISKETKEAYKSFIDFIKSRKLSNRLTILTTNYDLIFEYFAWYRGIPCTYPFKKDEVESLGVFNEKKSEYYVSYLPCDNGPVICKLHGSINYFNLEDLNNKLSFGISSDITFTLRPPRPAIFMLNAIWDLKQKIKERYSKNDLAIIPPTYAKLHEYSWLRDTWNSSIRAIENATHIIFIGYSMPESDGFIRAMISGAMAARNAKLDLHVFVIDPDKDNIVFNRYKKIFPHLNDSPKCLIRSGFCKAWKKGELRKILSNIAA